MQVVALPTAVVELADAEANDATLSRTHREVVICL
jgi:hypothetical protein